MEICCCLHCVHVCGLREGGGSVVTLSYESLTHSRTNMCLTGAPKPALNPFTEKQPAAPTSFFVYLNFILCNVSCYAEFHRCRFVKPFFFKCFCALLNGNCFYALGAPLFENQTLYLGVQQPFVGTFINDTTDFYR